MTMIYSTHLLRDCGLLRDGAIFARTGGLRGSIADVGGHAGSPLAITVRKPNITSGFRHD